VDALEKEVAENKRRIEALETELKCLLPFMRESKQIHTDWLKLKQAVLTATATSLMWALIVGAVALMWHGAGYFLKYIVVQK